MTIARTTPKRPNSASRKRVGQHHRKNHDYIKPYWPYLPILAIISFGFLLNAWLGSWHRDVLSYATNITISDLLSDTNNERISHGIGRLALNSTLNQAAQAKAADMAADNYWAHVAPDGKTPWTFLSEAGYSYETAGENLAYGFATSSDTITGWMNSEGHKANILNTRYTEVGFGIINIENYQNNGNQTLVVAMYGRPRAVSTPIANATPKAPTQPQTVKTAPAPVETTSTQTAAGGSEASDVTQKEDTTTPAPTTAQKAAELDQPEPKQVTRIDTITAGNVAWTQFALSLLVSVAVLIFLLKHSFAWHRMLVRGERFILHHPILDIVIVGIATLGAVLLQTSGVIK